MSSDERTIDAHPSYATISIRRYTGSPGNLFASSIQHGNTIGVVISRAEIRRDLNTDWIYPREQLIEVIMSPVQFAEMLTTTMGSGVPCTIRTLAGQDPPPTPPFVDKAEQFRNEFAKKMRELSRKFNDLTEMIAEAGKSKTITKAKLGEIAGAIGNLQQEIGSNIPFVNDMFAEQMEQTVLEAKGAIDAHLQHKALVIAQEGLKFVEDMGAALSIDGPIVEIG